MKRFIGFLIQKQKGSNITYLMQYLILNYVVCPNSKKKIYSPFYIENLELSAILRKEITIASIRSKPTRSVSYKSIIGAAG